MLVLLVDLLVFALEEDSAAEFPDLFRSSFDVDHVVAVQGLLPDDRKCVFVGGVERHFGIGFVFAFGQLVQFSGFLDIFNGLVEFDQGGLRGIAHHGSIGVFEAWGSDGLLGDVETGLAADHGRVVQHFE